MHSAAANAYARTAQATQSPRELEASLLSKAAYRLQTVADNWPSTISDLGPALTYNRKLWTILSTSATDTDNPLPDPIKQNIAQLAVVIFQRTLAVTLEPAPEKLALLVRINRDIAAGLRAAPGVT